ncbi:MAG: recombination mediator RecR [Alphaproteobacteria bacterium]
MTGIAIEQLVGLLAKLPGLGPRSARRATLQLIKRKDALLLPLIQALQQTASEIRRCSECGNIDTSDPCAVCAHPNRERHLLCVVADIADLWALERAGAFRGLYHVLGGTLSPLDGVGPEDLDIAGLARRAADPACTEVIIALNATVDGQTTAHYLTERLADCGVTISRLAHGVPVGGELDYLDDGTLAAALQARTPF